MEEHKVLGVPWNLESYKLIFDVSDLARVTLNLHETKRNLVSLISKFSEPLGYLSPVMLRFKILVGQTDDIKIYPTSVRTLQDTDSYYIMNERKI